MTQARLSQAVASVDGSVPRLIWLYHGWAALCLWISLSAAFLAAPLLLPVIAPAFPALDWLPGFQALPAILGGTDCSAGVANVQLGYFLLILLILPAWTFYAFLIIPRYLRAVQIVAAQSVLASRGSAIVDHGLQRQDQSFPSLGVAFLCLVLSLAAFSDSLFYPHLMALGCTTPWLIGALCCYGLALWAPPALMLVLQALIMTQRWPDAQAMPARKPMPRRARKIRPTSAAPARRATPLVVAPPAPIDPTAPIEEDGTPVAANTPRFAQPDTLFKTIAEAWASEISQAIRASDEYPTGFMQGRRQYYEHLAKTARKQASAARQARRENTNFSERQFLAEQISMCEQAMATARSRSGGLAPEAAERRTTRWEIDALRQHIMDLEEKRKTA